MNKRIRELAHEAWAENDLMDTCGYTDLQKFAELIIKECLSIADNKGAYQVMDDIIERFGVEL